MASILEGEFPTPDSKVSGGVGVTLVLLGGSIVAGASDLGEAGELVFSVLSGSHQVSTEVALSTFLIVAGLGGAVQSFLAGANIEQIDQNQVPIGIMYPAIIGAIISGGVVGLYLVPNSVDQYSFR